MTLEQADAARRRAVSMYRNFGDDESAAEFEGMTADEYADRQGIEIIASNPSQTPRGRRNAAHVLANQTQEGTRIMALKVAEWEQLNSHINDRTSEALASNSRAEMREALEEISDLTDPETNLIFNGDGTVEVEQETADESDADDGD